LYECFLVFFAHESHEFARMFPIEMIGLCPIITEFARILQVAMMGFSPTNLTNLHEYLSGCNDGVLTSMFMNWHEYFSLR